MQEQNRMDLIDHLCIDGKQSFMVLKDYVPTFMFSNRNKIKSKWIKIRDRTNKIICELSVPLYYMQNRIAKWFTIGSIDKNMDLSESMEPI